MSLPVQTKRALLASAGYNFRKWTRHVYSYSELVTLQCDGIPTTGLGHFFRCEETGEVRRWGFDSTFAKDDGTN